MSLATNIYSLYPDTGNMAVQRLALLPSSEKGIGLLIWRLSGFIPLSRHTHRANCSLLHGVIPLYPKTAECPWVQVKQQKDVNEWMDWRRFRRGVYLFSTHLLHIPYCLSWVRFPTHPYSVKGEILSTALYHSVVNNLRRWSGKVKCIPNKDVMTQPRKALAYEEHNNNGGLQQRVRRWCLFISKYYNLK